MFSYEGLGTGVQEFILTVYGTCMPMLNLNRRKGQDIERYYPAQDANRKKAQSICVWNS
jgi:AraC family transcriptional activator of mar-sox-rob regulon